MDNDYAVAKNFCKTSFSTIPYFRKWNNAYSVNSKDSGNNVILYFFFFE